jgi:hypothetical protein
MTAVHEFICRPETRGGPWRLATFSLSLSRERIAVAKKTQELEFILTLVGFGLRSTTLAPRRRKYGRLSEIGVMVSRWPWSPLRRDARTIHIPMTSRRLSPPTRMRRERSKGVIAAVLVFMPFASIILFEYLDQKELSSNSITYSSPLSDERQDVIRKFLYAPDNISSNQTLPRPNSSHSRQQSKFDPSTVFSLQEWQQVQSSLFPSSTIQEQTRKRILLAWPTIPTSLKGSDDRALDTVRFLSLLGYHVDLLHWTDYAVESASLTPKPPYNGTQDRERLIQAGVRRILGPFDIQSFSSVVTSDFMRCGTSCKKSIKLSNGSENNEELGYRAMILWLWPDTCYLSALMDIVQHAKRSDPQMQVVSAIDDVGIAARYFVGSCQNARRSQRDIEQFVMAKRPPKLLGRDCENQDGNEKLARFLSEEVPLIEQEFSQSHMAYGTALLYQEMYLYSMSNVLVGISSDTTRFLSQVSSCLGPRRNMLSFNLYV